VRVDADNNTRDQCYTDDMATLSAAIKAVEDNKEHPRVADNAMLIVKIQSNRTVIPSLDYQKGTNVSLTVYDAKDNSIVYEKSHFISLLSNDARQLLTEFLDLWAFLH